MQIETCASGGGQSKDDFKDDFGGPKSMKIYRWRFKNLSKS